MQGTSIVFLALGASLFGTCLPSQAQSLRCKAETIGVGESRAGVLQKCGQPVTKDSFCKPVDPSTAPVAAPGATVVNVVPCEKVDEWTYNPGYGQFMTTLRVEAGKVTAITYGDRVK
jgi:hypothetical protein